MIHARELRIGNWVYMIDDSTEAKEYLKESLHFDRLAQVTAFSQHDNGVVSHWKAKSIVGGAIHSGGYERNLYPILLTEEILLKCGFVLTNGEFVNNGIQVVYDDGDAPGIVGDYRLRFNGTLRIIDNLHQLQNLYWCLTGEELNVQL